MYQQPSQGGQYAYPANYPPGPYDAAWAQYYASQAAASASAPSGNPATPAKGAAQPADDGEPPAPGSTPADDAAPPLPTEAPPPPPPADGQQYSGYQYAQNGAYDANAWYQYQQQYYQYYGQYPPPYGASQPAWGAPGAPQAAAPSAGPSHALPGPPVRPMSPNKRPAPSAARPLPRNAAPPSKAEVQAQIAAAASAAAARVGRTLKPPATSANAMPLGTPPGAQSKAPAATNPATAKAMAAAQALASKLTVRRPSGAAQPAFVKVDQAKGAAPAAAKGAPQTGEHPPALRNFVMRFFARGKVTDAEKEALRKLIADAREKGELWTRDWDRTPLPTVSNTTGITATTTVTAAAGAPAGAKWGPAANSQAAGKSDWLPGPPVRPGATSTAAPHMRSPAAKKQKLQLQKQGKKGKNKRLRDPSPSPSDSSDDASQQATPLDAKEAERRRKRAGRFGDGMAMDHKGDKLNKRQHVGRGAPTHAVRWQNNVDMEDEPEELNWDDLVVKGTCQDLEKSYFRLTSAPDPSTVRPEPVLRRAYTRLVDLLSRGERNYFYALDQFKGQRQDLTVQHIKNDLTVLVYEGHARAALEYGDIAEFNQCQTQLAVLYRQGIQGCRNEFLAYRLLYLAVHVRQGQGPALLTTLKHLTKEDITVPEVAHALQVRAAVARYDYARFFKLYTTAPNLGRCIMDVFVSAMRRRAADAITTAIRPTAPIPYLTQTLGFLVRNKIEGAVEGDEGGPRAMEEDSRVLPGCVLPAAGCGKHVGEEDEEDGWENCLAWITASNGTVTGDDPATCVLDCKASCGNIITPQDTTKVAHGDANLAIDDFLSRAM